MLEVIQRSSEFLTRKGVESPRLQIELLLAHLLQMPRMKLYLNFDRVVTEQEQTILRGWVKRRGEREPVQYLVGSTSFCGLEMTVNRDVLVPRPETELLVEQAWKFLAQLAAESVSVLDFGTGSGCLAVAIASRYPQARVWAVDISEPALMVAHQNAVRHNVGERVQFCLGAGWTALPCARGQAELDQASEDQRLEEVPTLRFDLIVSNPPYIPTGEMPSLQPEVRDYEPPLALDGGLDGLEFYRLLASGAGNRLRPNGRLMLELGHGQAVAVTKLLQESGWEVERVEKDYSGAERILIARRFF